MKKCINCGTKLKDEAKFCDACGTKQSSLINKVFEEYDINDIPIKRTNISQNQIKHISIVIAIIVVLIISIGNMFTDDSKDNDYNSKTTTTKKIEKYPSGSYKVGTDIPAGEYILFCEGTIALFRISSNSNTDDLISIDTFNYNSIISISDGQNLDLNFCYAIPIFKNPTIKTDGEGMFKIGLHLQPGKYTLKTTGKFGSYYQIYNSSLQGSEKLISESRFNGETNINVSDGQYLKLNGCKILNEYESSSEATTTIKTKTTKKKITTTKKKITKEKKTTTVYKITYILNPDSMKIHYRGCRTFKYENQYPTTTDLNWALNNGYKKCGVCW